MTFNFDNIVQKILKEDFPDIFPMPEKLYPRFGITNGRKGGTYFSPEKEDITGKVYSGGYLDADLPGMNAKFHTNDIELDEIPNKTKGQYNIKTNLYRQKTNSGMYLWNWVDEIPTKSGTEKIISVEIGSKHYYCLKVVFNTPIKLSSFPNSLSEPRLRPTTKGNIILGNDIGKIKTSGKRIHNVYDIITIN
jgi:hypothetical protein